jgi:hypothetical protein
MYLAELAVLLVTEIRNYTEALNFALDLTQAF